MPEFYPMAGGNSSLDLSRTSKGEYSWSLKLYFLGHDMRTVKQIIANVIKARAILEGQLGQRLVATEEMSEYEKQLKTAADKAGKEAERKAKAGKDAKSVKTP